MHNLAYAGGVILSFLVVATVLLAPDARPPAARAVELDAMRRGSL